MKNIIDFIKSEMAARGMSYEQLAVYAGMSRQNLWDKMNKRVQPNFGNVRKILSGLDYEISIEKSCSEPDAAAWEEFIDIAEQEQVSYSCIEKLVSAIGYGLKIKTHKNEENVKKGIDN